MEGESAKQREFLQVVILHLKSAIYFGSISAASIPTVFNSSASAVMNICVNFSSSAHRGMAVHVVCRYQNLLPNNVTKGVHQPELSKFPSLSQEAGDAGCWETYLLR